jgi:hypothetical protein
VGPRAGVNEVGKSRPPTGFDLRIIQSVAIAIPFELSRPTFLCEVAFYVTDQQLRGPLLQVERSRTPARLCLVYPLHRRDEAVFALP